MKRIIVLFIMLILSIVLVGCSNDNDNTILYNAVMKDRGSIYAAQESAP